MAASAKSANSKSLRAHGDPTPVVISRRTAKQSKSGPRRVAIRREAGVEQIERGFARSALSDLASLLGASEAELAELLRIELRGSRARLSLDESDRVARGRRVYLRILDLFSGRADSARRWLRAYPRALNGRTPLELISTEVGARAVERLVSQIEHGVYP